jgi:hypothetical protein
MNASTRKTSMNRSADQRAFHALGSDRENDIPHGFETNCFEHVSLLDRDKHATGGEIALIDLLTRIGGAAYKSARITVYRDERETPIHQLVLRASILARISLTNRLRPARRSLRRAEWLKLSSYRRALLTAEVF